MVKGQKTRKTRTTAGKKTKAHILTIPQLRKAFDHMDHVVESQRKVAKHSFSNAVIVYREEWRKTFKRDLSPADAAAYLKFRYGMKAEKTRRSKTRGGGALAGAPLDYTLRPGVQGVYGSFPSYQTEGLDRYYNSAMTADCGKANGFPTDGSGASQKGGGILGSDLRMFAGSSPAFVGTRAEMGMMGTTPYPPADPTSNPSLQPATVSGILASTNPVNYIAPATIAANLNGYRPVSTTYFSNGSL